VILIKFHTEWNPKVQRMMVCVQLGDETYIERMTKKRWEEFINNLNNGPLVVGGVTLNITGSNAEQVAESIKLYQLSVAVAFEMTGSTEYV
jgi:hypothetical protein